MRLLVAAVALLSVAAGCGTGSGGGAEWPAGRTFLSTDVKGHQLASGTRIDLSFTDGEVRARAGCNTFSGEAYLDDGRLVVGELSGTAMACMDDAASAQDGWLTRFLTGAPGWRLDGNELTLRRKGVVVTLLDDSVAEPDRELKGTRWQLDTLVDGQVASSVPQGISAHLRFAADGKLMGHAGCNSISGTFQVDGSRIEFGDIAATRKSCGKAADRVERDVLAVLRGAVEYRIKGDRLTISNPSGNSLRLRAG